MVHTMLLPMTEITEKDQCKTPTDRNRNSPKEWTASNVQNETENMKTSWWKWAIADTEQSRREQMHRYTRNHTEYQHQQQQQQPANIV